MTYFPTSAELTGLGIADAVLPELAGRVAGLRPAVTGALGTTPPGDRARRLARATRSFIAATPSPAHPGFAPAESVTRC
jgi:hypothetical protein